MSAGMVGFLYGVSCPFIRNVLVDLLVDLLRLLLLRPPFLLEELVHLLLEYGTKWRNLRLLVDVDEADLHPLRVVPLLPRTQHTLLDPFIPRRWSWRISSSHGARTRRRRKRVLLIRLGLGSCDLGSCDLALAGSHVITFGV